METHVAGDNEKVDEGPGGDGRRRDTRQSIPNIIERDKVDGEFVDCACGRAE
jgi:hypothetical protein